MSTVSGYCLIRAFCCKTLAWRTIVAIPPSTPFGRAALCLQNVEALYYNGAHLAVTVSAIGFQVVVDMRGASPTMLAASSSPILWGA